MSAGQELTAPPPALFPDRATRTRVEDALTRALLDAGERVAQGSVVPTLERAALRQELAQFDFATPRALDELLKWTIARLEQGVVHMTCNIHKEMSAYVVVLQNGFYAIPDHKTGAFTINGLPPGNYTIRIWGEQLDETQNARKFTVTVGKGEPMKIAAN